MFVALSLSHRTFFSSNLDQAGLRRYLFILLAVVLLGLPFSSAAQTTQTLSLDAGWNLVSLRVQPDDSSFASIFDGSVSMAKNGDGDVYLPSEGIKQISTWRTGEGYQVYAETATTLDVSGAEAPLGSMLVELDEGWNVVPYLPAKARAVEKALVSIEDALIVVEDEDGAQYDPSASSSPLDSLRPGQGYKVYVDRVDTLRYPEIAETLDEALALTEMSVGSYVRVRGRDEPEDGGGGAFQVTESGCETDGGTCFVFDENVSAEQTLTTNDDTPNFANTDLVWGTVSAKVGPDSGEVIEDLQMHTVKGETTGDWINHKQGWIGQNGPGGLYQLRATFTGGNDNFDITYKYKYATSDRRLERVGITNSVNLAWWGAPKADPNNPQDATPYIGWALDKAASLYQNGPYDWTYVDIPDEYYWHHIIRLHNGVWLRGAGPERSVPSANWTTRGKLTTTPGKALYFEADGFDADAENDVYAALNQKAAQITNEYQMTKGGIQYLEIDGNYPENNPWENPDIDLSGNKGQNILQNSGAWSGLSTTDSGSKSMPDGATFHLQNVNVHHFGGNNFSTGKNPRVAGENIRTANSVRNHLTYSFVGDPSVNNVISEGYAWEVAHRLGSKDDIPATYNDLTFQGWTEVPENLASSGDLVNPIGRNVTVDGFLLDVSDKSSGIQLITSDRTGGNVFKNGTIRSTSQGKTDLWTPRQSGEQKTFPGQVTFDNVDVFNEGSGALRLIRGGKGANSVLENITVQAASGADTVSSISPIGARLSPKFRNRTVPPRNVIENLDHQHETGPWIRFAGNAGNFSGDPFPREQFIIDSQIQNVGKSLWVDDGRLGLGDLDANRRSQRLYFQNVTLNVPDVVGNNSGANFHGIIGGDDPTEMIRLRNCQDRNGRVSEVENQTYVSDASDEGNGFVEIPTSLLSYAHGRSATVTSGSPNVSSVTSVEVAGDSDPPFREYDQKEYRDPTLRVNLDGTIQTGETIEIEYSAYVTPAEDYQTTGLFVSRPVFDKTYTSGNGPFTVDLRGVAVSQESRDTVVYTASSRNTNVVTANVQSDDYTLELMDQGTGTTTITVDAEIPGVGTAQTTFKVSVE